jgi:hypothetical protein
MPGGRFLLGEWIEKRLIITMDFGVVKFDQHISKNNWIHMFNLLFLQ